MHADTSLGSASGMVATPWGTSESLRAKSLRPGPGNRPEEVARNQRERIFGAMIATVAERGYGATRVSDLVKLSGVSRRTFYDLFDDKETCFLETVQEVLGLSRAVSAAVDAEAAAEARTWEERALRDFQNFAGMVAAQPAAARVVLVEAYGAGPEVLALLDDEMGRFEGLVRQANLESPGRAAMPPEMVTAHVGALQEIARNRLGSGTEAGLPEQIDEIAKMVLAYPPPPEPLRLGTRLAAPRREDLGPHNHAERAVRAIAVVVAEKGYAQTTVDEVITRASMSASTFYANFTGKDDALLAAIDGAGAQAAAAVVPAFERNPDWPSAIRAAFGAFFDFLATRPALAHLLSVGVYGAGSAAIRRRTRALAPLQKLIERGGAMQQQRPTAIEFEVFGGAVYGLMYQQVRRSGPESLPALAPVCTYLALTPFIGAEEACAAANGDGRARGAGADPDSDSDSVKRLLLSRVLNHIHTRRASAQSLSRALGVSVGEVEEQIANLERAGLVVVIEEEERGGGSRLVPMYHANTDFIDDDRWKQMSLAERQAISEQIVHLVTSELDQAIALGIFDARLDRHLSRVPLTLDEEGWRKLFLLHYKTFEESIAIQADSAERLKRSGESPITGSSVQAMFEVPDSDFAVADRLLDELREKKEPSD
jgi:AcrR family transcriptional regulator